MSDFKRRSGYYNTHYRQKKWGKFAVSKYSTENTLSWGKSIEDESELGDYIKIKDCLLLPNIKNKKVVEIGCLDGKWSQYIVPASGHTILVDLTKETLPILNERLRSIKNKFTFYQTMGFELNGIQNNSADFIFSMDTFVRVKKIYLESYFSEFRRILKHDGQMLIHLPCVVSPMSKKAGFIKLHVDEIAHMMISNGFKEFTLDFSTINHGVLLKYGFR